LGREKKGKDQGGEGKGRGRKGKGKEKKEWERERREKVRVDSRKGTGKFWFNNSPLPDNKSWLGYAL